LTTLNWLLFQLSSRVHPIVSFLLAGRKNGLTFIQMLNDENNIFL
jgi:hypothetical protein